MSSGDNVPTSEESSFTFEQFVSLHKNQLLSSSVPELYWQTLFIKLKQEVMSFRDCSAAKTNVYSNTIAHSAHCTLAFSKHRVSNHLHMF